MARHSRCGAVGFDDVVVHTRTLRRGHDARVEAACEKFHGKFPEISIADYYSNVSTLSWNEPGKNDGPLFRSFILPRPEPFTVLSGLVGPTRSAVCLCLLRAKVDVFHLRMSTSGQTAIDSQLIPESNRKSVNFDVTKWKSTRWRTASGWVHQLIATSRLTAQSSERASDDGQIDSLFQMKHIIFAQHEFLGKSGRVEIGLAFWLPFIDQANGTGARSSLARCVRFVSSCFFRHKFGLFSFLIILHQFAQRASFTQRAFCGLKKSQAKANEVEFVDYRFSRSLIENHIIYFRFRSNSQPKLRYFHFGLFAFGRASKPSEEIIKQWPFYVENNVPPTTHTQNGRLFNFDDFDVWFFLFRRLNSLRVHQFGAIMMP